ncbi:MAG: hypothetical protein R6U17_05560 [Thermoplasmata archaeon]
MENDLIAKVYESSPKSINELEKMSLPAVLITLGGYVAIGLGFTHFLVSIISLADIIFIFQFLVNLLFGFALLISCMNLHRDTRRWTILSGVFGIILMVLGGAVGAISGLIAIIGAALGFLGLE